MNAQEKNDRRRQWKSMVIERDRDRDREDDAE